MRNVSVARTRRVVSDDWVSGENTQTRIKQFGCAHRRKTHCAQGREGVRGEVSPSGGGGGSRQ